MFILPDHMQMYRSLLGSILSFITVLALALYAGYKLTALANR